MAFSNLAICVVLSSPCMRLRIIGSYTGSMRRYTSSNGVMRVEVSALAGGKSLQTVAQDTGDAAVPTFDFPIEARAHERLT